MSARRSRISVLATPLGDGGLQPASVRPGEGRRGTRRQTYGKRVEIARGHRSRNIEQQSDPFPRVGRGRGRQSLGVLPLPSQPLLDRQGRGNPNQQGLLARLGILIEINRQFPDRCEAFPSDSDGRFQRGMQVVGRAVTRHVIRISKLRSDRLRHRLKHVYGATVCLLHFKLRPRVGQTGSVARCGPLPAGRAYNSSVRTDVGAGKVEPIGVVDAQQ